MPDSAVAIGRRVPVGAEYLGDGRTDVRVWAPKPKTLHCVLDSGSATALERDNGGYFHGVIKAAPGDRYRFRIDGRDQLFPDPASRFQPDGPHASSEVVDPRAFQWTDDGWPGVTLEGQVIYEMHVGTFTRFGTWAAAASELEELARLGITLIEVMPIAEWDGRFGWGYDGVDLFAPSRLYGRPDDFRRFVDAAHAAGVGVILDVVYNHFGPSGNYLREFSPAYFKTGPGNEWGDYINFDGEDAAPVRELIVSNAGYWIDEYHLDGLRLDATQAIIDGSPEHILAALGRRAREAAGSRSIVIVAENEPQDARLMRPLEHGGYGIDALWNDDFHHSAMVALTGRAEAYYSDTRGEPQEFLSAAKHGFLFQGQHYAWQRQPRGTPALDVAPHRFITFLQNHDQVANTGRGQRGDRLTSPGRWRAMTALLLLGPWTPMLFQGQEFAASSPFLYFADHPGDLGAAVKRGRSEFLRQFPSLVEVAGAGLLDDPLQTSTFERCRLDLRERDGHAEAYALHADLLKLRRDDAAFLDREGGGFDGAVLSASAFVLRYFTRDHRDDRLLIVNLGRDLVQRAFPVPLLAPPSGADWMVRLSTENIRYGGGGIAPAMQNERTVIPGESALVLAPAFGEPHA